MNFLMRNWFLFINYIANNLLKLKWGRICFFFIIFILLLGLSIYLFMYILQYNNESLKYNIIIVINVVDNDTICNDVIDNIVSNKISNNNFYYKLLKLVYPNNNNFPSYFVRLNNKIPSSSVMFNSRTEIEFSNSTILSMLEYRFFLLEKHNQEYIKTLENIASMLE